MHAAVVDGAVAPEPVIQTRGLTKEYGEFRAVDQLDLDVYPGEVFGLLGPNGAGKTTTILMLLGLTEPTGGTARVLGLDPARNPLGVKRHVGYLPDNVGFYGGMTGRENLRYTARLNGLRGSEVDDRIEALLREVGLPEAGDARVDTYSRGMRQRLGLADVLVKDPSVVILDEPTTAIDPKGVVEVLGLVRSLARDRGAAVLLSSHLLYQVQQVCDRVGIFVSGQMVERGAVEEIAERSAGGLATFEVGVEGDPDVALRTLTDLAAVADVTQAAPVEPGPPPRSLWLVRTDGDRRGDVVRALVEGGFAVWQLRRRGDELDEIYRRYFTPSTPGTEETRDTAA
jgi:ABC-2 type transport system ATP-binding protein